MQWHKEPWPQVEKYFDTDIYRGLSDEEAKSRLRITGTNQNDNRRLKEITKVIVKEFNPSFLISAVMLLKALLSLNRTNHLMIVSVSLLTTTAVKLYNLYLYHKNQISIERFDKRYTTVIRSGMRKEIKIKELVLGDVVLLKKNQSVPEDIRICNAFNLKINEWQLTGKHAESEKFESKIDFEVHKLSERINIAFKGTFVTEGEGLGIVVAKGENTEFGRLINEANSKRSFNGELACKTEKFICRAMLLSVFCYIFLTITKSTALIEKFTLAPEKILDIAVILASIPATASFFIFDRLLKKEYKNHGIDIKGIAVIEKLGKLKFMLVDQLNAINIEEFQVRELYFDNMLRDAKEDLRSYTFDRAMEIAILNMKPVKESLSFREAREQIAAAVVKFAESKGLHKGAVEVKYKQVIEPSYAFDNDLRISVSQVEDKYRAYIIGPIDIILDNCRYYMKEGIEKDIDKEFIQRVKQVDYNMSLKGLSTIALAYRNFIYEPSVSDNIGSSMVFTTLLGLEANFNSEASGYFKDFLKEDIQFCYYTEENKLTAYSNGVNSQLINDMSQVISGVEMDFLSEQELEEIISRVRIYARTNSSHRAMIASKLKAMNINGIITGETLRDLPAMAKSYISAAIGRAASFNVKTLADIYIKEEHLKGLAYSFKSSRLQYSSYIKLVKQIIIIAITEIVLALVLSLGNIFFVNILLLPIITINIYVNNRSTLVSDNPKLLKTHIIKQYLLRQTTYFILCAVSFYYGRFILGYLYNETAIFQFYSIMLLSSFDYKVIGNKLKPYLNAISLVVIIIFVLAHFKGYTGFSTIALNILLLCLCVFSELLFTKGI